VRLEQELKGFEDRKTLLPSTAHLPAARRPNPPPLLSAAVQENEGPRGGPRAQTAPPMESSEADVLPGELRDLPEFPDRAPQR